MNRIINWPFNKYLKILIILQITFFLLLFFDATTNLFIVLKFIFIFLYTTIAPGLLVLRLIKYNSLIKFETLILSIALSIIILMIMGLFINYFLPVMNIDNPISKMPLGIFIFFLLWILGLLRVEGRCNFNNNFINLKYNKRDIYFVIYVFFVCVIGVLSTILMNKTGNNSISIIFLILILLLPPSVILFKISEYVYVYIIFFTSVAILLHVGLATQHIWGYDVHYELQVAKGVIENGSWQSSIDYGLNTLLLLTILAPTYAILTNVDLVWVFKIIFPLIYAFVPILMYYIAFYVFKNNKLALFSSFVFIFYYGFYKTMVDKQFIAEFFLAAFLLILLKNDINRVHKVFLSILMLFGIVLSHYGVSYFVLFSILTVYLVKKVALKYNENDNLNLSYVSICVVLVIGWYLFVGQGDRFEVLVNLVDYIISNLSSLLFSPDQRTGFYYALKPMPSSLWVIYKILNYFFQLFICVGFIKLSYWYFKKREGINSIYFIFLLIFLGTLAGSIFLTFGMGYDRILKIVLLIASPLLVLGIANFRPRANSKKDNSYMSKWILAFFLSVYFAFASGLIFIIFDDNVPPYSITLKRDAGWPIYKQSEIKSMQWMSANISEATKEMNKVIGVNNSWKSIKSKDGLLVSEYYPTYKIYSIYNWGSNFEDWPEYIYKSNSEQIIKIKNLLNSLYTNNNSTILKKIESVK